MSSGRGPVAASQPLRAVPTAVHLRECGVSSCLPLWVSASTLLCFSAAQDFPLENALASGPFQSRDKAGTIVESRGQWSISGFLLLHLGLDLFLFLWRWFVLVL